MAQHLQFTFEDQEFACDLFKVDRQKLYGKVDLEAVDDEERVCQLATLAGDGKTLIPSGGTALAYVSPEGLWREKGDLNPVNLEGEPIEPVGSSFKTVTPLAERATYEDYFSHNIRLTYLLNAVESAFPEALLRELREGAIYKFGFSYRGGLEADAAFLFSDNADKVWMAVGKPTKLHFIGPDEPAPAVEEEAGSEEEEEDALMDFGAL